MTDAGFETVGHVIIARIHTPFSEKFGIPRQAGLVATSAEIVFEPPFRNADALRGLEGYSHIWLLWQFSKVFHRVGEWSPTVRPPRLGGNVRMGVFATRSPNRPNPIGLSCVRLDGMEATADRGVILRVSGADMLDGTPIFDIKPYLGFADSIPDAVSGFADEKRGHALTVSDPAGLLSVLSDADRAAVIALLSGDPRPSYQADPSREYGMRYRFYDVKFSVDGETARVSSVEEVT